MDISSALGRLLLLAILQDDRQLYGVEQLFDDRKTGNPEMAETANSSPLQLIV